MLIRGIVKNNLLKMFKKTIALYVWIWYY